MLPSTNQRFVSGKRKINYLLHSIERVVTREIRKILILDTFHRILQYHSIFLHFHSFYYFPFYFKLKKSLKLLDKIWKQKLKNKKFERFKWLALLDFYYSISTFRELRVNCTKGQYWCYYYTSIWYFHVILFIKSINFH